MLLVWSQYLLEYFVKFGTQIRVTGKYDLCVSVNSASTFLFGYTVILS